MTATFFQIDLDNHRLRLTRPATLSEYRIDQLRLRHFRLYPHSYGCYQPCWFTKALITTHGKCDESSAEALQPWLRSFSAQQSFQGKIRRKISLLCGTDPYEETRWEDDIDEWPAVTYVHVCMYLIPYPSPYTRDEMLNYKSLDSFKNFQSGWVREVFVKEIHNKRVVIGKVSCSCCMVCLCLRKSIHCTQVNHSQRMNDKHLIPWFIAESDGRILAAH